MDFFIIIFFIGLYGLLVGMPFAFYWVIDTQAIALPNRLFVHNGNPQSF